MPVTKRTLFSLRATVGYAVFAGAWILLSDRVLELFSDPHTLARFSTLKGLVFIVVTAIMLWVTLQNVPAEADIVLSDEAPAPWTVTGLMWGVLTPLLAAAIQWTFWEHLDPYAWLLMYPAVFAAAWLGGWYAGVVSTVLSAGLSWYLFVPPRMSWHLDKPSWSVTIGVFVAMGLLMSMMIDWLRRLEHRASNRKFEALVEQTLAGIYIVQGDRFRYVNPAFARMLGYDNPDDIIHRLPIQALVSPADRQRVEQHLQARFDDPQLEMRYSFTGLRKDGSPIDLEVHGRGLATASGHAVIGLALDVSERRRTEATLREKQTLLDRMSELAKVGGWSLDVATRSGSRTDGAARILDLDPTLPESLRFQDGLRYFRGEH
ncbi:MAG TPA: DUF4118 domain-containing protein, partial [Aquabacterium sp.]|uniref:DUF4118 domain-containing protein n=1 Tax=Aquabacterium sp. TaxID=1872578 RepID=UPI002E33CF4F